MRSNVVTRRLWQWQFICALAAIIAGASLAGTAHASYKPHHHRRRTSHHHRPIRIGTVAYHALLLEDADTGRIIYDYNGGLEWPPASMAKMMLLMVVEDQIKAGRFNLNSPVRISANAAYTGGSRLGLHAGQVIPLGELMKAALIRSANDAAVAVAEEVCGSTARCVQMMNARARSLGMNHTRYGTVEGLPPTPLHDADVTTAYDLATLARALIHQTNLLRWSCLETTSFDDGAAILHNTNHLIGHFEGADGIKTGFTLKAGFNLTATAMRGNMRLVAVVLGAPSNAQRFVQAAKLLDWGFDNFEKVQVVKQGELLPAHVRLGTNEVMQPVASRTVTVVVPKKDANDLKMDFALPAVLYGPVASDQTLGQVYVRNRSEILATFDAICPINAGQQPTTAESSPGAAMPEAANEPGSTMRLAPAVVPTTATPAAAALNTSVAPAATAETNIPAVAVPAANQVAVPQGQTE
jgi:D-alanyl-D-alanine carboxypeptidase (penicillin-binding protein 5/6)